MFVTPKSTKTRAETRTPYIYPFNTSNPPGDSAWFISSAGLTQSHHHHSYSKLIYVQYHQHGISRVILGSEQCTSVHYSQPVSPIPSSCRVLSQCCSIELLNVIWMNKSDISRQIDITTLHRSKSTIWRCCSVELFICTWMNMSHISRQFDTTALNRSQSTIWRCCSIKFTYSTWMFKTNISRQIDRTASSGSKTMIWRCCSIELFNHMWMNMSDVSRQIDPTTLHEYKIDDSMLL